MELNSVPTEIDEVQRRLVQLELAARQLAGETEEHAQERLTEIEDEIQEQKNKLAALHKQWEAEKSGLGDVQTVRQNLQQVELEFDQLRAAIGEKQSRGEPVEDDYRRLYELESRRRELRERVERESETEHKVPEERRLLRQDVGPEEIAQIVSAWTGVPVSKMLEGEREKLLKMEDGLHRRMIDQQEAVRAVANAVRRSRSGLQDPNRPIGSFIFLGPTGVGKTELCKALAEFLFDDERAMVRVDMSEFMERHSVARLIGAPPGYVGYEEGGRLTEAVRRRPYSVLLLDEIEKAHRDVFNVLLQVLDDGRLTDGQGRTVDFTNTIVVMTSNIGSQTIMNLAGKEHEDEIRSRVTDALRAEFLPEFLNRIDEVIVFHPLGKEEIRQILDLQLHKLQAQLERSGYALKLTDRAKDLLAEEGYDPVYGARPLKRVIQHRLQNQLAEQLLSGRYEEGAEISVDAPDGQLRFDVVEV